MALVFCPSSAWSQPIVQPSLGPTEIVIANEGRQGLSFVLRLDCGEWEEFYLESGDSELYDYWTRRSGERCENRYEFKMSTEGETVHYTLDVAKRYILRWDHERDIWNLYVSDQPIRGR